MTSRLSRAVLVTIGVFALLLASTAKAENIRVTEATDFWFEFQEETLFSVRTYQVDGYWSDPQLWLYNESGQLLAVNDDWFGLQSYIQFQVTPGRYRVRASVCCGNPNQWWQNVQYDLSSQFLPVETTTTSTTVEETTTTSTTVEETTTTFTTVEETTTTSSTIETWVVNTTTTTEPTPTSVTSTSSSPTSSSTTTPPPDPTTTTSTSLQPTSTTSTEPSTTTTVSPSSLSPTSTSSSLVSLPPSKSSVPSPPSQTTTSSTVIPRPSSTSSSLTPTTTVATTTTSQPEELSSTSSVPSAPSEIKTKKPEKVYVQKVGFGPIKLTIKVSESQRRTVVAAAIVQITAVASISTIASGGTSPRRRR